MKLIIIDNDTDDLELRALIEHASVQLGWDVKVLRPGLRLSDTCSEIIKESHDADVLLVDIALNREEEQELDFLKKSGEQVQNPENFGGMRICLRISSELPNLPIVLFSKF
jgi:hypothetical protein